MNVLSTLRRHRRLVSNAGVLGLLALWFVTLAPTAIHGPAAYVEVSGHSMDGTYKTGDLILTHRQDTYARGDIIVYRADSGGQVVHRIIGGDGVRGYVVQGDNNPDPDPWHPTDREVVGKAWHRFVQKAWLLHLPRQPWFAGLSAGLVTLLVLGIDSLEPRRRTSAPEQPDAAADPPVAQPLPGAGPVVRVPIQRSGSPVPARPHVAARGALVATDLPLRPPPTAPPTVSPEPAWAGFETTAEERPPVPEGVA